MGYIQGEARGQDSLFPPSLDERVPEDHLVRVIEVYVARLDLQVLGFSKAQPGRTGCPPYDPADLLKLYLYGYFQRIRSSRRLETECRRNVEVMWLLGRVTLCCSTAVPLATTRKPTSTRVRRASGYRSSRSRAASASTPYAATAATAR